MRAAGKSARDHRQNFRPSILQIYANPAFTGQTVPSCVKLLLATPYLTPYPEGIQPARKVFLLPVPGLLFFFNPAGGSTRLYHGEGFPQLVYPCTYPATATGERITSIHKHTDMKARQSAGSNPLL
jgi:hypothetical protein